MLRRLWAAAVLLLLAATWRLWVPQTVFPQVPLIGAAADLPPLVQQGLLAVTVVCLCGLLLVGEHRQTVRRGLLAAFAGSLLGLMAVDQHRLQPWAYQSLIMAVLLAAAPAIQVLGMLRLLAISVYAYSAVGKLDYQFLHTVGQQFLHAAGEPIGVSDWPPTVRLAAAALFPLIELLLAAALSVPTWRRIGGWAAVLLHTSLLILLGPLGMQHQPGVLAWNLFFIAQAIVLFTPAWQRFPGGTADVPALRRVEARHSESHNPDESQPDGGGKALGDAAPDRSRERCMLAWAVLAMAVAMPLTERYGYWDHWLSWSLYSPHSSRVDLEVHASAVSRLPPAVQDVLQPDRDGDGWRRVDLARWSIAALGVPVYPQARFQLGVALAVADRAALDRDVRLRLRGPSDRWTGARDAVALSGRFRMQEATAWFWLNARP